MTESWTTVAATGHRQLPRAAWPWVKEELRRLALKLRDECGTTAGISGMALGVDQTWAQELLYAQVPLTAAVPYPSQHCCPVAPSSQQWSEKDQIRWNGILGCAAHVEYVSAHDPQTMTQRTAMLHERNTWMVQHADALVAVWVPGNLRSGTANALRKATSKGIPIVHVDPVARRTRIPSLRRWGALLNVPVVDPAGLAR